MESLFFKHMVPHQLVQQAFFIKVASYSIFYLTFSVMSAPTFLIY
jgi:hypothetical protein